MRVALVIIGLLIALALVPSGASAATCSDFSNQSDAQNAANTRDADSDGQYCESLPCPCASDGPGGTTPPTKAVDRSPRAGCSRPHDVVRIQFSRRKYPNIHRHYRRAVRRGWPSILVVNRTGTDERRDRLMRGTETRREHDRDEYPPAVGRGRPNGAKKGLIRGTRPRGWKADVMYVPSRENRSHGSSMGAQLRGYCDGTRFRYAFR